MDCAREMNAAPLDALIEEGESLRRWPGGDAPAALSFSRFFIMSRIHAAFPSAGKFPRFDHVALLHRWPPSLRNPLFFPSAVRRMAPGFTSLLLAKLTLPRPRSSTLFALCARRVTGVAPLLSRSRFPELNVRVPPAMIFPATPSPPPPPLYRLLPP
jgi:hypothetical protein